VEQPISGFNVLKDSVRGIKDKTSREKAQKTREKEFFEQLLQISRSEQEDASNNERPLLFKPIF
jgi:hypothetical protein